MKLDTKHFGLIEIDKEKILHFKSGIPGFENCKDFILLNEKENKDDKINIFYWLQSTEKMNVCFLLTDLSSILYEYQPIKLIEREVLVDLSQDKPESILIYNITTMPEDIKDITVNLKAPVVINTYTQQAKQVIFNDETYSSRYYIINDIKNKRGD